MNIRCVQCDNKTKVVNSRPQKRNNQVWRRRQCLKCGAIFTTEETVQYSTAWTVKTKTGGYQPFTPDKLLLSLYRSCEHRTNTRLTDATGLRDTVIEKLRSRVAKGLVDSQTIIQVAQVVLNRFDMAASVHYEALHRRSS